MIQAMNYKQTGRIHQESKILNTLALLILFYVMLCRESLRTLHVQSHHFCYWTLLFLDMFWYRDSGREHCRECSYASSGQPSRNSCILKQIHSGKHHPSPSNLLYKVFWSGYVVIRSRKDHPYPGGSKTQVTFHRSLVAGHCFTFWIVTKTLNLANPRPIRLLFRPRVSQLRVLRHFKKCEIITCNKWPVECDLCFRPAAPPHVMFYIYSEVDTRMRSRNST